MSRIYEIEESGVFLVLEVSDEGEVFFLHCQRKPFRKGTIPEKEKSGYRLIEIEIRTIIMAVNIRERCREDG